MSQPDKPFSFIRNACTYALGEVLLLAGGIVLLPLYARCLPQADFGRLEILERVSELLAIALVFRGLPLGVLVLYRQSKCEAERGRVVGGGVLLGMLAVLAGTGCLALLAGPLAAELQLDSGALLTLAVLANLMDGVAIIIQAANQARTESTRYVVIALGQFLIKVLLCILLVAVLGWGIWGVVAASLGRSFVFAVGLVGKEWQTGLRWPDAATLRDLLHFALPFVPTGLCFFVLHSADRFFLLRHVDQAEIGIYGLGYRLATLTALVSLTPLFRVWSARMHDVAQAPGAARAFARMTTYLLAAYFFAGLGLCLFQQDCIALLAGDAFAKASLVVPPLVLAYGFFGASTLFDAAFYVKRQTRYKVWTALASTLVVLLLYAFMIPAWGLLGAALATLGGLAFHAVLTWRVAQRVFPVPYEYGRLLALLVIVIPISLMGLVLDARLELLPLKLSLWLLGPLALWFSGLMTRSECRRVELLLARAVRGWRNGWQRVALAESGRRGRL